MIMNILQKFIENAIVSSNKLTYLMQSPFLKSMKLSGLLSISILIIGSTFFSSCQSTSAPDENAAWENAKLENTIDAYDSYLKDFPQGDFVSKANTEITRILYDEAKTGNSIDIYDQYVARFPQGKNKAAFEPYVYDYISKQDSTELFEEYVKRFPEGKYISEFEYSIYEGIKNGTSSLTYVEFATRFPDSKYIASIDSLLANTALSNKSTESYDAYKAAFPTGIFTTQIDTTYETFFYNNAIVKNTSIAYSTFLNRFPRSSFIKTLNLKSTPEAQEIIIKDGIDTTWSTLTAPATLKVIEGTRIKCLINNPDFKPELAEYFITAEPEQSLNLTLKQHSKIIVAEDFTKTHSSWSFTNNDDKADVANNMLNCSVKSSQFQNIQKVFMDLNSNFEITARFKITDAFITYRRPYFGVLWGEETKVKFYFISKEGRYSYGIQGTALGTDNPYGYAKWDGYSENADSWIQSDNYVENGFNTLKVVKKDSQIKYFINDKYVHFENDMTRFRNSWVGFGMGNARVVIDYFKIEQYNE